MSAREVAWALGLWGSGGRNTVHRIEREALTKLRAGLEDHGYALEDWLGGDDARGVLAALRGEREPT